MKFDICPDDESALNWLQQHLGSATDLSSASLALYCWQATYGYSGARPPGRTDDEWAQSFGDATMSMLQGTAPSPVNPEARLQLAFLAKWAHLAYTTIAVGERYAAALMATSVSADAIQGIRAPWDAFVVTVPGGLLSHYDRIRFGAFDVPSVHENGLVNARARMAVYSTTTNEVLVQNSTTIESCLSEPETDQSLGLFPMADDEGRILRLAQRLVAGSILAALRPGESSTRLHSGGRKKRKTVSPDHRVVTIGRATTLDVRSAVRDYVSGRAASMLTVQSLVRGHYKRQVHGPQLSERKVIWIEPYWRGPDEAPVLGKTHVAE